MILATRPRPAPYGESMAEEVAGWPTAGHALLDELTRAPGRVALIAGDAAEVDGLVHRLGSDLAIGAVSVGSALADRPQRPTATDIDTACGDATILSDLDLMLWPALHVPLLSFIASRSRRWPTITVWPGDIVNRRATYSAPGRPDHHDAALHDVIVLRPRPTRFPDEVPYRIERIPQ
jgi:hypothetical protein